MYISLNPSHPSLSLLSTSGSLFRFAHRFVCVNFSKVSGLNVFDPTEGGGRHRMLDWNVSSNTCLSFCYIPAEGKQGGPQRLGESGPRALGPEERRDSDLLPPQSSCWEDGPQLQLPREGHSPSLDQWALVQCESKKRS